MVHLAPQLEPDVAERFDEGLLYAGWPQCQCDFRVLDGFDDGRYHGVVGGRRGQQCNPELIPTAVPRLEKPGKASAATDARREVCFFYLTVRPRFYTAFTRIIVAYP